MSTSPDDADKNFFDFDTEMVGTEVMIGNRTDGCVRFSFFTPSGQPHLRTVVGPQLTVQITRQLMLAVGGIPNVETALNLSIPEKKKMKNQRGIYFGQEYPPDVLQALGVLMVRVNLLDNSLVGLLSIIMEVSRGQAEALIYSTSNFKARVDMIRAVSYKSDLSERAQNLVGKALDEASAVTQRRNKLVHGRWSLHGDKFEVETVEQGPKQKRSVQIVTVKSLEELAVAYRAAGLVTEGCGSPIRYERSIARNTASTPDSGEPNS